MNAWLLDKCIAYAKAHRHPELAEQTVWEVFEAERPKLVPYAGRFDGFHAVPASVSKTCLVRFDNNKYSVAASAVGRPVEVQAYADRIIVVRQDGRTVAEHPRSFGRGDVTIADGDDLPTGMGPDGKKYTAFDYSTAAAVLASHGKGLLSIEEFFAAAYGVTEKSADKGDPDMTGLDAPRTSKFGLMQATGNMWVWGHDGDPDAPRASLFGGSWIDGGSLASIRILTPHQHEVALALPAEPGRMLHAWQKKLGDGRTHHSGARSRPMGQAGI